MPDARLPLIQALEPRRLLAIVTPLTIPPGPAADGTLTVNGTSRADVITVGVSPGDVSTLDVTVNGRVTHFAADAVSRITRINILGGDGSDTITINEANALIAIPVTLDGGNGD